MPFCACVAVVCSLLDLYHEDAKQWWLSIYFWNENLALVIACQSVYCLVLFFKEAHEDLRPTKPLLKFLVVKGIVFFTFFQDWCISIWFHLFPPVDLRADVTIGGLQATVMCIEMLGFAIAHAIAFPSSDYPQITSTRRDSSSSDGGEVEGGDGGAEEEGDSCLLNPQRASLVEWGIFYTKEREREKTDPQAWWRTVGEVLCNFRDVRDDTKDTWQTLRHNIGHSTHDLRESIRKSVEKIPLTPAKRCAGANEATGLVGENGGGDAKSNTYAD